MPSAPPRFEVTEIDDGDGDSDIQLTWETAILCDADCTYTVHYWMGDKIDEAVERVSACVCVGLIYIMFIQF